MLIPESSLTWQIINDIDAVRPWIIIVWILCRWGRDFIFAPHTLRWWIAVDLYYEIRPFVLPLFAVTTLRDVLKGASPLLVTWDTVIMCIWWYMIDQDPPDPRDRWGRRRRALRRLVTPRRAPAPVPVPQP
jgi:hypothetical protein